MSERAQRAVRAILVCLVGFSLCLYRDPVVAEIVDWVGRMRRLRDVRWGVGGVDEIESVVVEVSGEMGGVDNVV